MDSENATETWEEMDRYHRLWKWGKYQHYLIFEQLKYLALPSFKRRNDNLIYHSSYVILSTIHFSFGFDKSFSFYLLQNQADMIWFFETLLCNSLCISPFLSILLYFHITMNNIFPLFENMFQSPILGIWPMYCRVVKD